MHVQFQGPWPDTELAKPYEHLLAEWLEKSASSIYVIVWGGILHCPLRAPGKNSQKPV